MIYDTRRRAEAHTEERIGNPTASRRGTAAKFIDKRGFAEEMWAVVCFYRRKERCCFSFVSDPFLEEKFCLALPCLTPLPFFLFACVCVSLHLLFSIMLLGFSLKLQFFSPSLFNQDGAFKIRKRSKECMAK